MGRQRFEMPTGDRQYADPTRIGGGVGTEHMHGNDASTWTESPDETQRYRGLGEAAAKRQAYQVDFGKAMGDEANGLQARGAQYDAGAMMREAAMGNAPSQAAILGNQAGGQSLEAALGASAGARGGMGAAAQMQAQRGMGGMQQQAVGQYAGMRGNEMHQAQGAYGQVGSTMRAGDYAQQGMAQQRAEAQAQSEFAQRQLNQAAQMGYEQMGINNQQAQSDMDLRNAAIREQQNADARASHDARNARNMDLAIGGMKSIAGLAGSDERMKQDVVPLKPGMGAAAARYTASDVRTKEGCRPLTPKERADDEAATREFMGAPAAPKAARYEGQDKDERDKAAYEAREGAKLMKADQERAARAPAVAYANAADARNQDRASLLKNVPLLGGWLANMTAARTNETDDQKAVRGAAGKRDAVAFNEFRARLDQGARDTGHAVAGETFDKAAARVDNAPTVVGYRPQFDASQRQMQTFTREQSEADLDAESAADIAEYDRTHQPSSLAGSDRRMKEDTHAEGDMGRDLAQGLAPFEYEYKPQFQGAEHQQSGEKNVGPMAQNMASNPVTATAVKRGDNGLLYIDQPKALKVSLGGIGYLAAKQQKLEAELARLKGGR